LIALTVGIGKSNCSRLELVAIVGAIEVAT